jgi:Cdc6-like AAA superfamily ATPase
MVTAKKARIHSGFHLGGGQAESDPFLADAFFQSAQYDVLASLRDPRCFIIGRTGSGKSAALTHLAEQKAAHVIRINPEDLSLPYITNQHAVQYLSSLNVHLDPLWGALWKHVLLVEILRKKFRLTSNAAKLSFLEQWRQRLSRDASKAAALEYLDEFEGKFWCETDERVREITDKFAQSVQAEFKASIGAVAGGAAFSSDHSTEARTELADRFQRIVNDQQLPRLNKMMQVLDEDILRSEQDYLFIVIDDLDREWVDEGIANDLIRTLFRTVNELKRVRNLKVLVALRTNLLEELDFGRRGGQEEKLRGLMIDMRWTRSELKTMLDERARVAGREYGFDVGSINDLLPSTRNRTRQNALDYVLDRTLLRPRDAIAFLNECFQVGSGKNKLAWKDITTAEKAYSNNRLMALRDEWKGTYPGIEQVVERFRRAPARMTPEDLELKLMDIIMLMSDRDRGFPGVVWLTEVAGPAWSGSSSTWYEMYQPLVRLLYRIGLLGCAKAGGHKPVFFMDDELLVETESSLAQCEVFFIHRTYHAALDVQDVRPVV